MADEKRERYINPYTDFGCRDIVNAINTAKKEAKEEGLAEGLAEGRAEGRAEGERDKALESARRMKADGMPAELIAKYTGLTLNVVNSL